jgi:hypothetical protein
MRVRDQWSAIDWWRPLIPVLALAFGAVIFQLITALGRVAQPLGGVFALGPAGARTSRYVYIVAALMLPLIAIAVSYLFHRWRIAVIALVPVFILGLVVNIRHLILIDGAFDKSVHISTRQLVSDAAYSDLIELVPAETELNLPFATVTAGWLRDVKAQGRLPELAGVTPRRAAKAEAQLAASFVVAENVVCHESIEPGVMLDFVAGDIIRITGKSLDARFSFFYESKDRTRVQSRPVFSLLFNAVRVGAPHARLMFSVDDKVDKIERCTAIIGKLQ